MPNLRISLTVVVDVPESVANVADARVIADSPLPVTIYKPNAKFGTPLWSGKAIPRVVGVERE